MPAKGKKYYLIEHVGPHVEPWLKYLKDLGHQYIINDPWEQPARDPRFGLWEDAFRWETYCSACHWLARWRLPGTYKVMWVDEVNEEFEWAQDGPKEPNRFDERDWQEFHEWNGRSQ